MRTLKILRRKTFVASLMKVKVYMEDHTSNELLINGVPCRKIGTLKNGEEGSFEITNDPTRIFIIADTLSKNMCNEFYTIPAGEEDVSLSGKNVFSPFAGNPFWFDNVTDEHVLLNRKNTKKKAYILCGIMVAVGAVVGYLCGYLLVSQLL